MNSLQNIQQLIDQNRFDDAMASLDSLLSGNSDQEEDALVVRGKLHWRLQNYGAAVSDFERALSINPASEAGPALELARDIFDFYNPDLLNP